MIRRAFMTMLLSISIGILGFYGVYAMAMKPVLSNFSMQDYNQAISAWISPTAKNYHQPLVTLTYQEKRLHLLRERLFGQDSPWSSSYINWLLEVEGSADTLQTFEQQIANSFNNQGKPADQINYGENHQPYTTEWIASIKKNMQLTKLNTVLKYQANNRAITVANLNVRALPTNDPAFYSEKQAGQGYPFDNLQESALWAGTPVYILGESADHAWYLVLTPAYIGWVHATGIAKVSDHFVQQWTQAANKNLMAIIKTNTSIEDQNHVFRFSAYVGSVFPEAKEKIKPVDHTHLIMIPVKSNQGFADIMYASVSDQAAVAMPYAATPAHFANIIKTLIDRPYGWGGLYFYNDCSQELKSLYTPFGIWLPRHSSKQMLAGKMVNKDQATMEQRLSYLIQNGQPLMTIVYIGGHVILYVGHYPNPNAKDPAPMVMTYQDVWGLRPADNSYRAVIGKSVFLPLLKQYPQDKALQSLADDANFQVAYLNEMPSQPYQPSLKELLGVMA